MRDTERHRHLEAYIPVAIVVVVVSLAAAYVPLFASISGKGPRVFGFPGALILDVLAFAGMGFLIARRYPANPLGWVMLAVAVLLAVLGDSQLYGWHVYRAGGRNLPLGPVAAWLGSTLWGPALALLPVGVLLFPDGHALSRRWKRVLLACIAANAIFVCAQALAALAVVVSGPISLSPSGELGAFGQTCAPCPAKGSFTAFAVLFPLLPVTFVLAAAGLITNTVRSQGERRQQMKWLMYAAALSAAGFAMYVVSRYTSGTSAATQALSAIAILGFAALPVGAGVAIFKYRLYDIDLVISRTLVYGALAMFITAVYVGIAVGIGALVGGGGKPNLALSILATAIVAVGFQPLRERLQRVANRLVYGKRATPYEVLSQFSERVAESYATDEVMPRMARILAEGTGAHRVDVWLRSRNSWRDVAVWPLDATPADPVQLTNGMLPSTDRASRIVEVRHQGELLGALGVNKRGGETLTPVEEKLLSDLADQAGLVLKNVGLTSDLEARLAELRASRQRLVTAQDEERRRLERNLHDGAQQHLVALKVKLGLAEMLLERDPTQAESALKQLKSDADEALETLRDLARGIYPPLLAEKGLADALASQARKATVRVTVDADGIGRYTQEVEAAVYFCCLEALQNIEKYAHASNVHMHLSDLDGAVSFEVSDDGDGFDVGSTKRGAGLTNMADRLDALGGTFNMTSAIGQGTTIAGSLQRALVPRNG